MEIDTPNYDLIVYIVDSIKVKLKVLFLGFLTKDIFLLPMVV